MAERTESPYDFKPGLRRLQEGAAGLADHVPIYAQMSHHSARLAGESTIKFFSDAETFLRCQLAAGAFYRLDAPTIHYDVYNIESEALGAALIWQEKAIPVVDPARPMLRSVSDFSSLRPPRKGESGRMPFVLEINRRLVDMGLAPKVRFTGLFTLAANLVGLQELIMAIVSEPENVHRLMRFLTEDVVAPWIVCQRERCGSRETATGSDALASPPILAPEHVREFCLRYAVELERLVGKVRLAGLWGESNLAKPEQLLDIKREGSPGMIQVLDPDVTALGPALFRSYADRVGIALTMGLDANLVGMGSVAEITARARRFIEEGGVRGRFILFINDIPYDTPSENVLAVVRVAESYKADRARGCYVAA